MDLWDYDATPCSLKKNGKVVGQEFELVVKTKNAMGSASGSIFPARRLAWPLLWIDSGALGAREYLNRRPIICRSCLQRASPIPSHHIAQYRILAAGPQLIDKLYGEATHCRGEAHKSLTPTIYFKSI